MAEEGIYTRYIKAWSAVRNPDLDGTNPHFKNRYATLRATLGAVRDACESVGLAYQQLLTACDDGSYVLCSSVMDADGDFMPLSEFPVETPPNAQAFGSEMTYKKRQQAQADWGIVGEEDDDGEAAVANKPARAVSSAKREDGLLLAYSKMGAAIEDWCKRHGHETPEEIESAKDGVRKRPEWASKCKSLDYIESVIREFQYD